MFLQFLSFKIVLLYCFNTMNRFYTFLQHNTSIRFYDRNFYKLQKFRTIKTVNKLYFVLLFNTVRRIDNNLSKDQIKIPWFIKMIV